MEFRHELKYIINHADYTLIRLRLLALMKRDRYAGPDGLYNVRSLYFDDLQNSAYNDKYFGLLDRQKYRIRVYNCSDRVIHLERKIKKDRYVTKQSAELTRGQFEEILRGNYDFLLAEKDPLFGVFYHECRSNYLRPRVVVEYEREPLVMEAGSVRITFDRNVRAGLDGWDIFNKDMAAASLLSPDTLVMEVKYSDFLPAVIQEMLPRRAAEYSAVSKYILGCDRTLYKRVFVR